jgi:ArsR family transcriptional regulator
MRHLADTFKALSDETRLQMMALLLANDELCVCDFVGVLGLTQSKASRHLRYLYNAGLVKDRREGVWIHYRLAEHPSPEQTVLIDALARTFSPEEKADLSRRLAQWRHECNC